MELNLLKAEHIINISKTILHNKFFVWVIIAAAFVKPVSVVLVLVPVIVGVCVTTLDTKTTYLYMFGAVEH